MFNIEKFGEQGVKRLYVLTFFWVLKFWLSLIVFFEFYFFGTWLSFVY